MGRVLASLGGTGLLLLMWASDAVAYVGPGLGLGAIGALLAIIFSVLLAVGAFVWYPLKRLIRRKRAKPAEQEADPKDVGTN